ncbi:DUF2111 domain-containing protein [Methanocella arvoryzae]|uniref:DUF2111 domain-containing protein n=1 Tax=Methanocella arvoryzae (strain DSM 22066 / NBRC 105507 / MRE50) TaxID=351160 RepID=Q0W3M1_METAR|nr:DUF2111 domain-containing protein [Methanocella arvoryzae]CAJ37022.1 conserved hypothetical protein [Methanocella arvoryzae MRE50]
MDRITISADSSADDLASLALCIHALTGGLPVTARSMNRPGVQVEDGQVRSRSYTGPILEQVLAEGRVIKGRPPAGAYKGIPVIVAPIKADGKTVVAIGVVDTTGSMEIKALMDQYAAIHRQVNGH